MDLIKTIDLAAGGMTAQRTRLNVISMNLANANTTKTDDGTAYRRKTVIFESNPVETTFSGQLGQSMDDQIHGVKVREVVPVQGELKRIFDPSHPDADKDGYVFLPNVDVVQEMVHMLNANRSYEANAAVIRTAKDMALRALDLLNR
ncbi:MAG: flagellar basal body rod protein FlgC [Desulfobacteraceae bacterium]|nr:MAG: flagellar basal body rod protein FlgC [Desulfobacteraceae bacterium]